MKMISYIGKSNGNNSAYVASSSELNRVVANTVLCFGTPESELGWHKKILAEFPADIPEIELESKEKDYILAAYEECKRLGPGKNWEILNKTHLGEIWSSAAKPVFSRLRGDPPRSSEIGWMKIVTDQSHGLAAESVDGGHVPRVEHRKIGLIDTFSTESNEICVEANFYSIACLAIGSKVLVPMELMYQPGLKRSTIKARVFFMVLREYGLSNLPTGCIYVIKISTLRYLLKEPNLSPAKCFQLFEELAQDLEETEAGELSLIEFSKGTVKVCIRGDNQVEKPELAAYIDYEKFIRIASAGRHCSHGRRYYAVESASQYFEKSGKGIPYKLALPMITGRQPPDESDARRWRELHSTCSKALKKSEPYLSRVLGAPFATNFFPKKKLARLAERFFTRPTEFQVLRDNSEVVCSNLYVMQAD